MNSLNLVDRIYAYLGYHSVKRSGEIDRLIDECLADLNDIAHLRYTYKYFDSPPEFLRCEPYTSYLKGSTGVFLAVMTLGGEVDNKIKFLTRTDGGRALVLDACASAYLEQLSDGYEKTLGDNLSYRFCPGYGGSNVNDVKFIFDLVHPEKIGVTLTETGYMLPSKSMAGVIAVGGGARKTCKNCIVAEHCEYRKRGERCYTSAK